MGTIYKLVKEFKKKYPLTVAFNLKRHATVLEEHLNPGEKVIYVFTAQKNYSSLDFLNTYVIALTNKRLMLGTKRLLWGYFYTTITPDMFNDLSIKKGLIWGKIVIDSVKEEVVLSNIQPSALAEIETQISDYMMKEKRKYRLREKEGKVQE